MAACLEFYMCYIPAYSNTQKNQSKLSIYSLAVFKSWLLLCACTKNLQRNCFNLYKLWLIRGTKKIAYKKIPSFYIAVNLLGCLTALVPLLASRQCAVCLTDTPSLKWGGKGWLSCCSGPSLIRVIQVGFQTNKEWKYNVQSKLPH